MAVEFIKLRLKPNPTSYQYESNDNANRYEFQASDGYLYTISRFEEKTFPLQAATEMLSDNSNLEELSRA
jgi:hypothetical protein